ncbi:cytochrome P450 [Mycena galopus ATCC 62051]|nr:cytochrome P450 [Mycena galopus ATCC 62051]
MSTASIDPTVSTLRSFILAILTNPGAQRKAQSEIDTVIGRDRLPDFRDRDSLPYVSALLKEVLRWRNVTLIGIPHYLVVEEEYHIMDTESQRDRLLLGTQDDIPDPYSFKPERFLADSNTSVLQPESVFRFGRRVVPATRWPPPPFGSQLPPCWRSSTPLIKMGR